MYTAASLRMSKCFWYRGRGSRELMPREEEEKSDHPLAYYKNRPPEKMENLRSLLTRRPSMLSDCQFEDDGELKYSERWYRGPTVVYTDMHGERVRFLRGGLSAKTRGGPAYMYYRRCWNYFTTREWALHYLHKITFPGGRTRRRYKPDLSYRDEFMSPEGPKIPVHPGGGGDYWTPKIGQTKQGGWTSGPATPDV